MGRRPIAGEAGYVQPLRNATGLVEWYPLTMRANWLDLGADTGLGALRLRLTTPLEARKLHPHLTDKVHGGRRVWLDEVLALMPLGEQPLAAAVLPPWPKAKAHAPIAVRFKLDQPGRVTLVIEDQAGKRIRNLVADADFPAGDNVAWWDGLDDLGRDVQAAGHGLYHVPGDLVTPGTYQVRGLTGPAVSLKYQLSPDNAGEPPWPILDNTGGWGTNHTPPSCAAFVPADRTTLGVPLVFIGSYIAEGGHGLFWVDPDGRKRGGVGWLGGHWTGAQTLAVDDGAQRNPKTAIYVASGFEGEVRFTSLDRDLREQMVLKLTLRSDGKAVGAGMVTVAAGTEVKKACSIGDLAARDGLIVASLPMLGELWFIDAARRRLAARMSLPEPSGVAFAADGGLLATSRDRLVRLALTVEELTALGSGDGAPRQLASGEPRELLAKLDQPRDLATMPGGDLIVSEWGQRHQVRVLNQDGKLLRTIGKAGAPALGPYDPLHLNRPAGVAADDRGRLWITEASSQPKRVGLWGPDGALLRAWYGPSRYGGGGTLDPFDRTRFHNLGMTFRLDWQSGAVELERILWRDPEMTDTAQQFPPASYGAGGLPETPHRVGMRRFFSNWTNSNPTNGCGLVTVWEDAGGKLRPVAAIGNPWGWNVLETAEFAGCWPVGVNRDPRYRPQLWLAWADRDGDGVMQPAEVKLNPGANGGITVQPDLAFVLRLGERIVRIPATVSDGPVTWAFDQPEELLAGAQGCASSGGDTYLLADDGAIFAYPPPQPFSKHSVGGGKPGAPLWSYPNMWPGLHPSHEAAVPDRPGMLIGPTRLNGHAITPRGGEAGPLIFLNQNMGNIAVLTSDGLMVTTLFRDSRTAPGWRMPARSRDMDLTDLSLGDETFWPTVTQVQQDGSIYLCTGAQSTSSLVRVDGLERIRRLAPPVVVVTAEDVVRCTSWQAELERERQARAAPRQLAVPVSAPAPTVDGELADWAGAEWATVDERGTRANFDSNSKPYTVQASLRLADGRLFAAWRSNEAGLCINSAAQPTAPFKTGSALELMLGSDPAAPADRQKPVAGDLRLTVTTRPDGKSLATWAVLYRAVVPGTAAEARVPFSSPWRTVHFDLVKDVSSDVALARKDGNYELSIPLAVLGVEAVAGRRLRGDLGVLRGSSGATTQRVYWSNKATGITADVPSEAELAPGLWGTFELR